MLWQRDALPLTAALLQPVYQSACSATVLLNSDQRVYRQEVPLSGTPGTPTPITPEGQGLRFADYAFDAAQQRLVAVAEEHPPQAPDSHHVDNYLVGISECTGKQMKLCCCRHACKA